MPRKTTTPDFETALAELEQLVERMESGNQTLEEALRSFQRGIELARACQEGLKEAEQRVEKLVQQNGVVTTEPYQGNDSA
ncbi:MAG: exodeoxyribonuclease VII small subunit [Pseudomonadota bacterium]|nr:exodeoxyribonuclease VII small subunit [Pseudomonadota bacterium]